MTNRTNKLDTPFWRFMGRLGDWILLSLAWFVCSLPVITMGAATAALLAVCCQMAAKEDTDALTGFFRALRRNWRQATLLHLVLLGAAILLIYDLQLGTRWGGVLGGILTAGAVGFGTALVCGGAWSFGLLARFEYQRVRDVLKNGLILAAARLPASLLVFGLVVWAPVCILLCPELFSYVMPLAVLLLPGCGGMLFARAMRPAFVKIEQKNGDWKPDRETNEEETKG